MGQSERLVVAGNVSATRGAACLAGGCATALQPDPLEPFNRKVFAFNEGLDQAALKPVATTYVKVPVDLYATPLSALTNLPLRNTLTVTGLVATRAKLLPVTKLLDEVALDRYLFTRDAYLQRRGDGYQGLAQCLCAAGDGKLASPSPPR